MERKKVVKERMKRVRRVLEARRHPLIYRRVIKRRTYYGLVKLMKAYYQIFIDEFPEEDLKQIAEAMSKREMKEFYDLLTLTFQKYEKKLLEHLDKVLDYLFQAYKKGSSRVLDKHGKPVIKVAKIKDSPAIREILASQQKYIKNLTRDQVKTVFKVIQKGLELGWSNEKIADAMVEKVKKLTKDRALLIARTEIVKAHNTGLITTMKDAGVKRYRWVAVNDNRTCPICKRLHGKVFRVDDPNAPLPVRDTHPNCRCTIVAEV